MTPKEYFSLAWHRQSYMMFDDLGLSINRTKLRSEPIRAYLYQQLNGTDWLSRLWCRHIRPRFFKKDQAALELAIRTITEVIKAEFMQSIVEQAKKAGLTEYETDGQRQNDRI